jgi:peroxiredoxin
MFDQLVNGAKLCLKPIRYFSLSILVIASNFSVLAVELTASEVQGSSAVARHFDYLAPSFSLAVLAYPAQSNSQKSNLKSKTPLPTSTSSPEFVPSRQNAQYPRAYQVQSLKDYQGRQVYLEFWDSACSSCLKQLQNMAEMNVDGSKNNISLLAISVDKNPRDALKIIQKFGLNFPVLSDPSGSVARKYGVSALPMAFWISASGVVKKVVLGRSSMPLTLGEIKATFDIDARIGG